MLPPGKEQPCKTAKTRSCIPPGMTLGAGSKQGASSADVAAQQPAKVGSPDKVVVPYDKVGNQIIKYSAMLMPASQTLMLFLDR